MEIHLTFHKNTTGLKFCLQENFSFYHDTDNILFAVNDLNFFQNIIKEKVIRKIETHSAGMKNESDSVDLYVFLTHAAMNMATFSVGYGICDICVDVLVMYTCGGG